MRSAGRRHNSARFASAALSSCSDASDDEKTDDEDGLHGVCHIDPVGVDKPPRNSRVILGKYVAKVFARPHSDDTDLYTGKVRSYDQAMKEFTVEFNDGEVLDYTAEECLDMIDLFEEWYHKLNTGLLTRAKAQEAIRNLYA